MEIDILSNCCYAFIVQADQQGHGKCSECGDNCVPESVNEEKEYTIPDLSWKTVLVVSSAMLLIDGICNIIWSFH